MAGTRGLVKVWSTVPSLKEKDLDRITEQQSQVKSCCSVGLGCSHNLLHITLGIVICPQFGAVSQLFPREIAFLENKNLIASDYSISIKKTGQHMKV